MVEDGETLVNGDMVGIGREFQLLAKTSWRRWRFWWVRSRNSSPSRSWGKRRWRSKARKGQEAQVSLWH